MHLNIFTDSFSNLFLLFFIPALINLGLFVYSMFMLPNNRVNNSFSLFVLLISLWQLSEGIMHCIDEIAYIELWFKTTCIIALFVTPYGIIFALNLFSRKKRISFPILLLTLFIPSIVLAFWVHNSMDLIKVSSNDIWKWSVSPNDKLINKIAYFWVAFNALIFLALLIFKYYRSKNNLQIRKQTITLAIGFSVPLFYGLISEIAYPFLFEKDVIPYTSPLFTFFSIAALLAIIKYSLLDFSPINHLDQILDSLYESVLIIDKNDRIMYANEAFCQLLNLNINELKGSYAYKYFEETNEEYPLTGILKKNESKHLRIKSEDGMSFWLMVSGSPYKDNKGETIGHIGLFTNINSIKMAKQSLADERMKLKMAIEAVNMITFDIDIQTSRISMSDNVSGLLGTSEKSGYFNEIFTKNSPGADPVRFENLFNDIMLGKDFTDRTFSFTRPDNAEELQLEMKGALSFDNDMNIIGLRGVIIDITEKMKTEAELNHRRELLKTIFENEPECVKVLSVEGELLEMNPAGIRMLEADTLEEIIEAGIINCIHPDDLAIFTDAHERAIKGESLQIVFRNITLKNNIKWVESNLVPLRSQNGKIESILNVTRDITDNKQKTDKLIQLTETLEKSENRLLHAQEIAHLGSWEVNLVKGTSIWSDEAYRIYGIEPGEHNIGVDEWLSYIHPEDLQRVKSEMEIVDSTSEGKLQYRIVRKDGEIRHVRSVSKFETDREGNTTLFGVVLDITESKQSEIKLRRLLDVTEKQNRSLQNFAYIVSHNIRSHSANISGLTDLLILDHDDEITRMLKSSADKLSDTIGNLNSIITIQSDANKVHKTIYLYDEIKQTMDAINSLVKQSNASINIDVPKDFVITGVPSYVESILLNLMTNAIKYKSPERDLELDISLMEEDEYAVLTICDNGIGIDLDIHGENIFGLYKTFHGNADAKGLGLYIVKNQIEAMNGKIEIESSPDKGTCFKVYFNMMELMEPVNRLI